MQKPLVIGNWKLFPNSPQEAERICVRIKKGVDALRYVEVGLAVPHPFLFQLKAFGRGKSFTIGAQDVFWESEGAFSGEVSPQMLISSGAKFSLVGHSERRALGESDEIVNKKVRAATKAGLRAVLCVGENARDKSGAYLSVLEAQITKAFSKVLPQSVPSIVIAYEPVWAIGKDAERALSAREVQESVLYIRKVLSGLYGKKQAFSTQVLYGGSVDEVNTRALFYEGAVSGLLVGRASRDPEQFTRILEIANEYGKQHR